MVNVIKQMKTIIFQVEWLFMSPKAKYAYLWNRTKNSEYTLRYRQD